jgi:hypothetical protein
MALGTRLNQACVERRTPFGSEKKIRNAHISEMRSNTRRREDMTFTASSGENNIL